MQKLRIGWIGTGVMGKSMCLHLLNKGYQLNVFNRTKDKTNLLIQKGAIFKTPKELAKSSDAVILMLGYPKDVEQLVLGQQSILKQMNKGQTNLIRSLLIDHTTSRPSLAEKIQQEGNKYGVLSVDAPVSGGDVGARDGKLVIMAGGREEGFQKAKNVLQCYSSSVQLMGGPGKGQHTKMTNQIILAGNMIGLCEGLIYAYKNGLKLSQLIDLIKGGAAGSASLAILGPRMLQRNFEPGFYVHHFVKDLQIALQQASRSNLCLPNLSLVKQFYCSLKATNCSQNGTQALIKVLQKLNNIEIKK